MFDQSSGQVFKEWTVPRHNLSAQPDLDWSRRRLYPLLTPRGPKGPRSLVDMAINVVANNVGELKEEYFESIPARLLWRIWRFLEARGVCFHGWKHISRLLLPEEEDTTLGLFRFRQHICRPDDELKRYTQPLTSLSLDFITHLVISGGCEFSVHEMLCLTDIKNLGILELIQPGDDQRATFPEVTDRLVRGWTEKEDPFPLLRILRIWGDRSVTQESFRWISKFPSLALYDVIGSREEWSSPHDVALAQGWEMRTKDFAGLAPAQELQDSLLRYLMMFVSSEDVRKERLQDMRRRGLLALAKSIDLDLVSLCSDSRCTVRFVAEGQAPALLDYLTDSAKVQASWDLDAASREARACHGLAFEPWAFWLYSLIGQLSTNADLKSRGFESLSQAVAGPFVLPSKPMACLFLGHSGRGGIALKPAYVSRGLFETDRFTFTRSTAVHSQGQSTPKAVPASKSTFASSERADPALPLRRQKRKRLHDVLEALSK